MKQLYEVFHTQLSHINVAVIQGFNCINIGIDSCDHIDVSVESHRRAIVIIDWI